MSESQISVRYAKALFQSASEKQLLERVNQDMKLLSDTCKLDDFRYMLEMPSMQSGEKRKLVDSILQPQISGISLSMIKLVIKNKREAYLPGIARYFMELNRRAMGIRTATLVTALPVDDSMRKRLKALIKKAYHSEVELTTMENRDVIGGFVLTVDDLQYDAIVASHLRKMKKQLLQTSIEN